MPIPMYVKGFGGHDSINCQKHHAVLNNQKKKKRNRDIYTGIFSRIEECFHCIAIAVMPSEFILISFISLFSNESKGILLSALGILCILRWLRSGSFFFYLAVEV